MKSRRELIIEGMDHIIFALVIVHGFLWICGSAIAMFALVTDPIALCFVLIGISFGAMRSLWFFANQVVKIFEQILGDIQ